MFLFPKNCPIRLELDRLRKCFPVLWVNASDGQWLDEEEEMVFVSYQCEVSEFTYWFAHRHSTHCEPFRPECVWIFGFISSPEVFCIKHKVYLQHYLSTDRVPASAWVVFSVESLCFLWSLLLDGFTAIFTFMRNTSGFIIGLFFGWPVFSVSVCFLWRDRKPHFHWHTSSAFLSLSFMLSSSIRVFLTSW